MRPLSLRVLSRIPRSVKRLYLESRLVRRHPLLRRLPFAPMEVLAVCRRGWWSLVPHRSRLRGIRKRLAVGDHYWLFILGVDNSGTTLMQRILGSHPLIRSLPDEGQNLTRAFPLRWDYSIARIWSERSDILRFEIGEHAARAEQAMFDWSFLYDPPPGVLLDKSPSNTIRAAWLQHYFAPARFVAMVRNPYAVAEGIRRREGHSLEAGARHWRRANDLLLADWHRLENALLVRYEDLCEEPESQLRRIEEFLGLPGRLDREMLSRPFQTPNLDGEPASLKNFNTKSMERLSSEDLRVISEIVEPLLGRFGYEAALAAPRVAQSEQSKSIR